jgi:hypothetical protein
VTKILTTAVRCLAGLALAVILPPWVTAVPVIFLSVAAAIAVVRSPRGAEARFGQVADDRFDDTVAENAERNTERNTEFMELYLDNAEFRKAIQEAARRRAYRIITDPARDEALARLRARDGLGDRRVRAG